MDIKIEFDSRKFCILLFIFFLILKLCDVITWSWLWVFAPLWIPPSILGLICAFALIITAIVWIVEAIKDLIK